MFDVAEPSSDVVRNIDFARGGSPLDALCLMWQNLHPTHTETLTIKFFVELFFKKVP